MRAGLAVLGLALAAVPAAAQTAAPDPSGWRNPTPEQPEAVLVRGATVWTSGPRGRLEGADLLVRRGRVAQVGRDLTAPAGAVVIEAAGKHVTPGLIDAHSHAAVEGGVNEGTRISTAEVRIADVVDPESINLYWQLAGGLTVANLLHGSANAIGGQRAVIKLRWGQQPAGLLMAEAPPGIKFALGENPKQSNWNVEERRFPQTRQGVEQVLRERFRAARDYRRRWEEHRARRDADRVPPRRDLELEALLEILDGRRDVHAHSYRADEILMLLRLAEELGFRVRCFQHALEAYKVADELAAHGAGASSFSDWWAYKYEVIDAIPYNAALLHRRGVVTSLNSDDSELARRLNLEAAKAVRYGELGEEEALLLVTLNPARQLGIAERVGSLEPGKDADFVVWTGHPLSTYSIVEQTWIDGRRYFDRAEDLAYRGVVQAERDALLAKARAQPKDGAPAGTEAAADEEEEEEESPEKPPEDIVDEEPDAPPAVESEGSS